MALKAHNPDERKLVIRDDEHFNQVLDYCDYVREHFGEKYFEHLEQFEEELADYLIRQGEEEPEEEPEEDKNLVVGLIACVFLVLVGAVIQKCSNALNW